MLKMEHFCIVLNLGIIDMAKVSKLNLWFYHYTNDACPRTFLNASASVVAAKYKTKKPDSIRNIGSQNYTKLSDKISLWFDEAGLSEASLKKKLLSLMEAKETKFQKIKGAVSDSDLSGGVSALATSGTIETGEDGKEYSTGDTLLGITVDAIETQRRSLDMAFKIKDMYAAKKIEHTGKGGGAIEVKEVCLDTDAIKSIMDGGS